jgi:hypothetical protein
MRRGTFELTLPDGKKVRCWRRDRIALKLDVALTGQVYLRRPPGSEVWERVDPASIEGREMEPRARRIG